MNHYHIGVQCALEYKGRFLVIQQPIGKYAGGLLAFPGGGVEKEDVAQNTDILIHAAKREIFEEVCVKLKETLNYVTSSYFAIQGDMNVLLTIFHCILTKKPEIIPSPTEVPFYSWMSEKEINHANNAPEWLKNYVALIKQKNL